MMIATSTISMTLVTDRCGHGARKCVSKLPSFQRGSKSGSTAIFIVIQQGARAPPARGPLTTQPRAQSVRRVPRGRQLATTPRPAIPLTSCLLFFTVLFYGSFLRLFFTALYGRPNRPAGQPRGNLISGLDSIRILQ